MREQIVYESAERSVAPALAGDAQRHLARAAPGLRRLPRVAGGPLRLFVRLGGQAGDADVVRLHFGEAVEQQAPGEGPPLDLLIQEVDLLVELRQVDAV